MLSQIRQSSQNAWFAHWNQLKFQRLAHGYIPQPKRSQAMARMKSTAEIDRQKQLTLPCGGVNRFPPSSGMQMVIAQALEKGIPVILIDKP